VIFKNISENWKAYWIFNDILFLKLILCLIVKNQMRNCVRDKLVIYRDKCFDSVKIIQIERRKNNFTIWRHIQSLLLIKKTLVVTHVLW